MIMAEYEDDVDALQAQFSNLEDTLGNLGTVTSTFQKELSGVQSSFAKTGREASGMSNSISASFRSAFDDVIFDGARLTDALKSIGGTIANSALRKAVNPVKTAVGSSVTGGIEALMSSFLPFAKGTGFNGGRVAAFARGGVVDGPTRFPMRGGTGLMGEAGPEAIMPLARGADGRLGIRGAGSGGPVNVTMNISTPDAQSFQKSRSQIAADMSRALQRGRRNL
jgi:lambda family phage tail tape measure protein